MVNIIPGNAWAQQWDIRTQPEQPNPRRIEQTTAQIQQLFMASWATTTTL